MVAAAMAVGLAGDRTAFCAVRLLLQAGKGVKLAQKCQYRLSAAILGNKRRLLSGQIRRMEKPLAFKYSCWSLEESYSWNLGSAKPQIRSLMAV